MTPFKGAYMHFFMSFPAPPDSSQGLGLLSQLAGMLEGHVESIFPYSNLATDPNSGDALAKACLPYVMNNVVGLMSSCALDLNV